MSTRPSVNLYCLLARESPVAVVLRRGPARRVQLLRWDLQTDCFQKGQWIKGRVYERYCDLSPSGRYLVYWAGNHKAPYYHWTAVSRPPYLTALSLWPTHGGYGGGLFVSEKRLLLSFLSKRVAKEKNLPDGFEIEQWMGEYGGAYGHITENRLLRDGWHHEQIGLFRSSKDREVVAGPVRENSFSILGSDLEFSDAGERPGQLEYRKVRKDKILNPFDPIDIWRKKRGRHLLEMRMPGLHEVGGPAYPTGYRLICAETGGVIWDFGRTDWADWDANGDLLYAQAGCIFRVHSAKLDSKEPNKLIDLTDAEFEPIVAPSEFQRW